MVKPLAGPPVSPVLLEPAKAPLCELASGAQEFSPAEIAAALDCWRAAWAVAAGKHVKLASAVRLREARLQDALKAVR